MAAQPPLERKDPLSVGARRHRIHPGHRVEGRGRRREVQAGRSPLAGDRAHRPRRGARRQPRARRIRARRLGFRDRQRLGGLSDHAERARRRLPARSASSLDSLRAAAGDPSRSPRSDFARCATFSTIAGSSWPTRRSSRRPPAKARPRCSRSTTSRIRKSSSRRAASSTPRPTRWRSAASTTSDRCSAPRNRRRAAISPSSGWSSRRWPTPRWTT